MMARYPRSPTAYSSSSIASSGVCAGRIATGANRSRYGANMSAVMLL